MREKKYDPLVFLFTRYLADRNASCPQTLPSCLPLVSERSGSKTMPATTDITMGSSQEDSSCIPDTLEVNKWTVHSEMIITPSPS
jgi:hypothetical protein